MQRAILAAVLTVAGLPAAALEPVDVELVLAVDVSRSIDEVEAQLQRQGYVEAFRNQRVIRTIGNGPLGRIGVTYVEWAAVDFQRHIIGWTLIKDAASARAFADQLEASPRQSWGWTSVSGAIDFAVPLFGQTFEGTRQVIDVSGDGRNNSGRPAAAARDDAVAKGITVNGLAIINDRTNFGRPPDRELDAWYRENVIGGPGAFLVVAEDFEAFGEAVLNKLLKEIADRPGAPPPSRDGG
ncbi:uncharacterized protein DUF1194 [Stella humosa]|uniref:Uncharacterized protein DUF1194 n=1 Tax=Stella humosa TaxID=94 RepID=A0A3N1MDB3_9PROT|nr:DUF1194 domain-containing protein [Stella humosa]ROQ01075.1 uncharacterized protein DUF1194 [Stella humosa]